MDLDKLKVSVTEKPKTYGEPNPKFTPQFCTIASQVIAAYIRTFRDFPEENLNLLAGDDCPFQIDEYFVNTLESYVECYVTFP